MMTGVSTVRTLWCLTHYLPPSLGSTNYSVHIDLRTQLAFKTVGTIKSRTALKTRVSAEVYGTGVGEKGGAARLTSCKTEGRWELCGDLGTWGQGKWWVRGRLNHTLRSDSSPLWGSCNPITAHLPYSQWKTCLTQNPVWQDRSLGHLPGEEARGCTGSSLEPHRLLPDSWCLLVTIFHPALVPHSR